jgi:TM2 domain-containing membrane protein YozV
VPEGQTFCGNCGCPVNGTNAGGAQQGPQYGNAQQNTQNAWSGQASMPYGSTPPQPFARGVYYFGNDGRPVKSKVTAGILGILLGDLGIHEFYLENIGLGILMLLFCWTAIPGIIGLIQGIIYLSESDEQFALKNNVRVEVVR